MSKKRTKKKALSKNRIYNENCLTGMNKIEDASVDFICCDLPYQTTKCKWDIMIPFDELWEQYKRVLKPNGTIALFGAEPFASMVRLSNKEDYKYDWIWNKVSAANFVQAKNQPLRQHECISIFHQKDYIYNPQGLVEINKPCKGKSYTDDCFLSGHSLDNDYVQTHTNYPKTILTFSKEKGRTVDGHPNHATQKPLELIEYLVKTYTNPGMTVMDNCMGSGTTAIACLKTGRDFIGFETDTRYFEMAQHRINDYLIEQLKGTA